VDGTPREPYNARSTCGERALGRASEAGMRRKIRVVGAMIERGGKYLITQRPPTATLPLLWEFPGGRVEAGETDEEALARELREEMDLQVRVGERVIHVEHAYENYDIDFCVYRCEMSDAAPIQHRRVHAHRWVRPDELDDYEFPAADEKTIAKLLDL
jgi:8-oxo-dGTP diphosphatase